MSVWAFLDESGDPNIESEQVTHFSVAAVVVHDADLAERRAAVEEVRRRYFQTGPIKSKKVGADLKRRLTILRALDETGYQALGLVVDKRRLIRDSGLRYRQSFMKYLSRFVYERLFRAYPTLRVRADRHGRVEFMESFERYLTDHCTQTELFHQPPEIEFVDSATEVLVQAADFVAGSVRIAYSDETSEEDARAILSLFRRASLGVQEWPPAPRTEAALQPATDTSDLDEMVRRAALRSAYWFLAKVQEEDDDVSRMQVEVLQELIGASRFEPGRYMMGDALAELLRERGYPECTRNDVRRTLIAPMRDEGVLIVSSSRGYALASSVADVDTHLQLMEERVRPMLRRVRIIEEQLRRVSIGKLDVLGPDRFRYLRELLNLHLKFESSAAATTGEAHP